MDPIKTIIRQPVTVAVGVILIVLAGLVALQRIPIQLTPNVEDTIVSVSTFWEGASPEEIEQNVVDPQEERLQGLANLVSMTSVSQQNQGQITLEFATGTPKEVALREVSDKLREVPSYPENVDEPVVEASDPENRDYIAWIIFGSTDDDFDVRTLQDFAEDRIKPILERVPGMSEVGVLGGREREVQIRFDPARLSLHGITPSEFVAAIRASNRNVSAGQLEEGKRNVRVRTVGQFDSLDDVEQTIVAQTASGPVRVEDVAEVVSTYKEPRSFVRATGRPVIAINAQREIGSNVMEVMAGLKAAIADLNAPGSVLETKARELGLDGELVLRQVYDQTVYIDDALALVQSNIFIGGGIAIFVLLLFLRSVRSVGIVALAIPISVIGAIVAMVALGRTVNVISLAGMAFAVGMVVDNAIVVLENIFRHLQMGKTPRRAAHDGAREVWGAVLASTLTTIVVFIPILLIQEEAGQLFRDIALAICASVGLSLLVSVTVIPTAAARILRTPKKTTANGGSGGRRRPSISGAVAEFIYFVSGSVIARVVIVTLMTAGSIWGTLKLMPPADYLPAGNRNLVFGLMIPPPGYNLEHQAELAGRIESTVRPFWEAGELVEANDPAAPEAVANLPSVPTFDFMAGKPGDPITPPPLSNYFLVAFDAIMFQGGVSTDPERAADLIPLFNHATRGEVAPGILAFANQAALFRTGGSSGSAVKIDVTGDDLAVVTRSAEALYGRFLQNYGPYDVRPNPGNFNIPVPELRVDPNLRRLADAGLTVADLGLTVAANADGAFLGDYKIGGETIDLAMISQAAVDSEDLAGLGETPVATAAGTTVPLRTLADLSRVGAPEQINRVNRRRAVTLEFTPPQGLPLEQAMTEIEGMVAELRANGAIPPGVDVQYAGSASRLAAVQEALLGDGTVFGTATSSLILALLVVYLMMCVLFQSFVYPFVIMFSVPLATLGGFAALFGVFLWSLSDRHLPIQNLDVLTMLGFVILIGIVVNNAILLVHQTLNFMKGEADVEAGESEPLPARRAIAESVRTRVRPILMSTLTSVGGMLPLVLMPGAGSELYRGLGSVVVGGLLVSTFFTLVLVPLLLSLVLDLKAALGGRAVAVEVEGGRSGRPASTKPEAAPKPRPAPVGARG